MQIFVRSERCRTLQVALQTQVWQVKQMLGHQSDSCCLSDGQHFLLDKATLEDYGIGGGAILHLLGRGLGGASSVSLTVKPRIQKDKWSLYWKESMETKTEILDDVKMDVPSSTTVAELHKALQDKFGWQPTESAERLEGFKDPWDVSVFKGRVVDPASTLEELGIQPDEALISVRRVLVPEGWKIIEEGQDEDDISSDEEDW